MRTRETLIIGGGQAGLAMSRALTARNVSHVVLERGRVGERWRSERWDSLRLLTPRWHSRLPNSGASAGEAGEGRDGFMHRDELVRYLEDYASGLSAPILTGTRVESVGAAPGGGYRVSTSRGLFEAPTIVIATGACDVPLVPDAAAGLDAGIEQWVPTRYKRPDQLPPGGVLVVGASATGLQLAEELQRSGRPVTLSVGRHTRVPRRYRGRDLIWWLDRLGILDEDYRSVPHLSASRHQPSLQLVGRDDHRSLDLGVLQAMGVRLVGRFREADRARVVFEDDLADTIAAAERKLQRLLGRIDRWVEEQGLEDQVGRPDRPAPITPSSAPSALDLAASGIRSVLWATGFRREYPWLRLPILDDRGEIAHEGGVTPAPGVVALGLHFLRRRQSTFIGGVGRDASDLADHLVHFLRRPGLEAA